MFKNHTNHIFNNQRNTELLPLVLKDTLILVSRNSKVGKSPKNTKPTEILRMKITKERENLFDFGDKGCCLVPISKPNTVVISNCEGIK